MGAYTGAIMSIPISLGGMSGALTYVVEIAPMVGSARDMSVDHSMAAMPDSLRGSMPSCLTGAPRQRVSPAQKAAGLTTWSAGVTCARSSILKYSPGKTDMDFRHRPQGV